MSVCVLLLISIGCFLYARQRRAKQPLRIFKRLINYGKSVENMEDFQLS
jgi:hypothetical protein